MHASHRRYRNERAGGLITRDMKLAGTELPDERQAT